jgi:hypothetical protein
MRNDPQKTERKDTMKKIICLLSMLLVASILLANVPALAQSESKIHLKFSTWHPPASREVTTVWTPMLEELK